MSERKDEWGSRCRNPRTGKFVSKKKCRRYISKSKREYYRRERLA